jgi:signal transduction histidine kinase
LAERLRAGFAALRRSEGPPPTLSRWAWAADVALALVLAAVTVYYATRPADAGAFVVVPVVPAPLPPIPKGPPAEPLGSSQAVLAALTALPLIARRRCPLVTFWLVLVATLLFTAHPHNNGATAVTLISCLIAAYSAVTYSPYRARAIASLVIGAVLLAARHDTTIPDSAAGYLPLLLLLAIGLAANTVHVWRQRVSALEAEREEATRRAVAAERARIARELHDVVSHNVAVMVVQAGAARKVLDVAPDRAREALLAVEASGRAALSDLRNVMGLLTMGGDETPAGDTAEPSDRLVPSAAGVDTPSDDLAPQPGLDQLPLLAGRVRATGVPVDIAISGTPVPLTAGADLAAYRVVQEALTNALKHAAGSGVRIAVDYGADAVRIVVTDTGGDRSVGAAAGNGRGLAGLRERLAVLGGTLKAGPRPTGGFRVTATIPTQQALPPMEPTTIPVEAG